MTNPTQADREAADLRDLIKRLIEAEPYELPDEAEEDMRLAAQALAAQSAEIERLKGMAGKICDGCGSVEHIDTLRAKPGVISCCPERKLVDAKDLWLEIDQLRREKAEAVELLKNLLPSFTGGIDPIEAEPVVKARAFLSQQKGEG